MKSSVFESRYLFHVHTQATDGQLSVDDYFEFALHERIETLIFLEHIRRNPTYAVERLLQQITAAARKTRVCAVVGFETKVLPDGSIDIEDRHLALADVIGLAEHGSPTSADGAVLALRHALTTYPHSFPSKTFVWVHPGLWFRYFTSHLALHRPYLALLQIAQDQGVLIEKNLRYGLADEVVAANMRSEGLLIGADAHSRRDLQTWISAMVRYRNLIGGFGGCSRASSSTH